MAITSNKKLSASDIEYINKAQAYQSGTSYTPSNTVNTDYWSSSGGGGKNALHGTTTDYKATGWTEKDLQAIRDYVKSEETKIANTERDNAINAAVNNAKQELQGEIGNYINSALSPALSQLSNLQAQQQMQYQQANALSKDQINSAYDASARDYYRLYKTQQKELPQNLSKAGVTGGASESSELKLMNAYSDNLYKNESARNSQLAGVDADYNNKVAQNSVAYANQLSNAYLQMAQQAYKHQQEEQAAQLQAQAKAEADAAEQQAAAEVAQWNENVRTAMQKRLAQGKTVWTWTDDDGKIHWTTDESKGLAMGGKKLTPSTDSTKKKVTDEDEDGKIPKQEETNYTSYNYKTLEQNMTNALLKGATKQQLQTFVDPIQAALNAGSITEAEARRLLDMLK